MCSLVQAGGAVAPKKQNQFPWNSPNSMSPEVKAWARNVIEQQVIELEWLEKCSEDTKMLDFYVNYYLLNVLPDFTSSKEHLSFPPILAGLAHDCDHIHTVLQNAWTAQM